MQNERMFPMIMPEAPEERTDDIGIREVAWHITNIGKPL
jgi:hypothetical protein